MGLPEPGSYADPQRNGLAAKDLLDGLIEHLFYSLGRRVQEADHHDLYMALSYAVRDRLMTRYLAGLDAIHASPSRVVAYLSAEFLIGPQLGNNLLMLGIQEEAAEALKPFGIHEYKRQHLNALQVIAQYLRIKNGLADGLAPRTVIFGGKAAPGYAMAKLIIRFINGIADVVNADPDMDGRLRVIFLADYNVKLGERVYPAADLSEQISTAGLEASGTGNMKFMMNGALTIGTLDGANVEIREQAGEDNFFLFGRSTEEIAQLRGHYRPWEWLGNDPVLAEVFDLIGQGHFSQGDTERFRPLTDQLRGADPFFVLADFSDYLRAQDAINATWADRRRWNLMALLNTARSGFFSSDRAIAEYAERIWDVKPTPVTMTAGLGPN